MIEKFFEYPLDPVSQSQNVLGTYTYRFLHSHDYSMIKFSIRHFADFYRGLKKLSALFSAIELPRQVGFYIERINKVLLQEPLSKLAATKSGETFTAQENLYFTHHVRTRYRSDTVEMIDVFSRLEAWYSMATAVKTYNLQFPVFRDDEQPFLKAEGLYHILLQQPVAYDMVMHQKENFLFLTGANMAGKSTLIKAIGSSVFLAHIGMGVPAKEMELTMFDGLLTNINVVDNISKGESYFFNEVQRIKNTIYKINDGKKWLVLIDELFKGTNVQDAMKCSYAVIKGLIKIKNSVFILSTHLYELGEELKDFPNICFKYFETTVTEDQLEFSYQLKNGISNDRIGYVILKREKVVEMLEKL
jgi:DNA mismatch repair ATPase MutS